MSFEALVSLAVIVLVMAVLMTNRVAVDVAMVGGLVMLMVFGVIDPSVAVAGFSHPAIFIIGSLFVVAAGLHETGALQGLAQRLLGRPKTITEAQARLMGPVALMSAFMNNTPIVAMYLPIVSDWARKIRMSSSKLFMPLSFAAILGGKMTLIGTSSNIVIMELYVQYFEDNRSWLEALGVRELSTAEQFWGVGALGLPTTLLGVGFVVAFSRWLLPERKPVDGVMLDARKYTVEMEVQPDSFVVSKTIEDAGLRHLPGLFLIEIERGGELIPAPSPEFRIRARDRLVFAGVLESVVDLRKIKGLTPATDQVVKVDAGHEQRTLVEAVVSHNSSLVGRTVRESRFRTLYNAAIIAVHRNGEQIKAKVGDIKLQAGDTLLLETHRGFVDVYRNSEDFYLVSAVEGYSPVLHERAWISIAILAVLVSLLALTNLHPVMVTMLCALGMIAGRCVSVGTARNSIQWHVVVVIACALGMGEALAVTGASQVIADRMLAVCAGLSFGPQAMLFVTFLLAALFGQLITNNGSAVLMFPIALATARELGVNPEPFVFTLMVGAGSSFSTPVGYQTNLMVYGPGGYRFLDFARLGVPLTILIGLVVTMVCPLVFPFGH